MLSEDGLSYASEECFYRVHMLSLQYRNSPDLFKSVRMFKKNWIFSNCFQTYKKGLHLKREAAIKKSMLVGGDKRQRENEHVHDAKDLEAIPISL